ncbi:hypothetical protein ACKKBF_B15515 [Auxenochlorella protothecoides x Auxenochlorella symbiontica]|uniref:Uncharacterized protein n=1 Tax=Auxenochlorella protothecoides TaxID=3075 RepID=A0A1D2A747_AUXPR|nr:hypothetical protein APUTEX25_001855 [Auxenochlorella protothecoides]|eukprot:RMZ57655.1 hypothetical protein APUTEX25_001855 [Auxenochlorella protothecoides]
MAGEDIWSPNSQVPRTEVRVLWLAGWLLAMAFAVSPWGYTHLTVPSVSTPVTPARWTQDIWFVIFGLQAVGMVYQLLPSGYDPDGDKQRCVHATSFLWALGAMCTLGWLAALAQGTPGGTWLGLACILAALFITLRSLLHLYRLRRQFGRTSSRLLYLAYFLPTSMLAAWLTLAAATTAVAALIVSVDPADLDLASLAFLAGVMLLGAAVTLRQRDTVFGLTLVWGLVGTYEGTSDESAMLQWASLAAVALMVVLCALSVLRRKGSQSPSIDIEAQEPLRAHELR